MGVYADAERGRGGREGGRDRKVESRDRLERKDGDKKRHPAYLPTWYAGRSLVNIHILPTTELFKLLAVN